MTTESRRLTPAIATDLFIDRNTRFYHGDSMLSIFRTGDRLSLEVVSSFADVEPGDVIVFCKKNGTNGKDDVVHRVISFTKAGLITRGDNNLRNDAIPVQLDQIIGKVAIVEGRRGEKKNVSGGLAGLRIAKLYWATTRFIFFCRTIYLRPYRALNLSKIVSKFWHPEIVKVRLQIEHGHIIKYLYDHHTVAVWDTTLHKFDCRKPFDLVIPSPLEKIKASS